MQYVKYNSMQDELQTMQNQIPLRKTQKLLGRWCGEVKVQGHQCQGHCHQGQVHQDFPSLSLVSHFECFVNSSYYLIVIMKII